MTVFSRVFVLVAHFFAFNLVSCRKIFFDTILKFQPRKLIPQCFAEPENAFQVENWHIILDFLVNFWLFLLISSFLDLLTVSVSKVR